MKTLGLLTAGLTAALLLPNTAAAQADQWLPFTGCWQPVGELAEGQPDLLCVVPERDGVVFENYLEDELLSAQTIVADGQARSVTEEGCESLDVAEFAPSGQFVTTSSEYTCEGGAAGGLTGLIAMVSPIEWVHVQVVESDGEHMTGLVRYELARDELTEAAGYGDLNTDRARALRLARLAASSPLTVDDVIEASNMTDPSALSAWIVERGEVFRPNADRLVELADAGVAPEVIDMVVAVSYPGRFAIDTGARGDYGADAAERTAVRDRGYGPYGYGYGASAFWGRRGFWGYSPYSAFGYSPYYYGPGSFGYGGYGGYGYWGYQPRVFVVQPGNSGSRGGRAVRGRGYTRGTPASSGTGGSVGSSRGSASSSPPASSRGTRTGRKAKRRGG